MTDAEKHSAIATTLCIGIAHYADIDCYPPTYNNIKCLAADGYRVNVTCRKGEARKYLQLPESVSIKRISSTGRVAKFSRFIRTVISEARATGWDVAIAYDMHALMAVYLARFVTRGVWPVIFHSHDIALWHEQSFGGKVAKAAEWMLARRSDAVVLPEAGRISYFLNVLRVSGDRIHVIPNYAPSAFATTVTRPDGLPDRYVIYQGGVGPDKSLVEIVRSIPFWPENTAFVCIGPGSQAFKAELIKAARDLKVDHRLMLLPGVSYSELPGYTQNALLGFALFECSDFDRVWFASSSNKIFEYAASGIPVLIYRTPQTTEIFGKYKWAILIAEKSERQIGTAVFDCIKDRATWIEMQSAANRDFKHHLSFETGAYHLYKRLLLSLVD